jgi:hypothetical protein
VAIIATSFAGNASTNEVDVVQSSVTLTINPISADQLNQSYITVTGTVGDPSQEVWANGVQAQVSTNGAWEADNVPVSPAGTAVVTAEAGPSATEIIASQTLFQPQPVQVALESTSVNYEFKTYEIGCGWSIGDVFTGQDNSSLAWNSSSGGSQGWLQYGFGGDGKYTNVYYNSISASSIPGLWLEANDMAYINQSGCGPSFTTGPVVASSKLVIEPQGQTQAGTTNLYLVSASAMEYSDPENIIYDWNGDTPLPAQWLEIQGQPLTNDVTTNDDGSIWGTTLLSALAGTPVVVTPLATQVYSNNIYTFNVQATVPQPLIQANGITLDPVQTNATFCVGQQIQFSLAFSPALGYSNAVCTWTLPPTFVNSWSANLPGSTIYTNDSTYLTTTNGPCTCWYVNGSGGTVSVQANIILSNGKTVPVSAVGQFAIERPSVSMNQIQEPRFFTSTYTLGVDVVKLGSSGTSTTGVMAYTVEYDSESNGLGEITQTCQLSYAPDSGGNNFPDWRCDGVENYDGPQSITPGTSTMDMTFNDGPQNYTAFSESCEVKGNFIDYIRWNPNTPGSIYVTLGIVTWNIDGKAVYDEQSSSWPLVVTNSPDPVGPVDSDQFPIYTRPH